MGIREGAKQRHSGRGTNYRVHRAGLFEWNVSPLPCKQLPCCWQGALGRVSRSSGPECQASSVFLRYKLIILAFMGCLPQSSWLRQDAAESYLQTATCIKLLKSTSSTEPMGRVVSRAALPTRFDHNRKMGRGSANLP